MKQWCELSESVNETRARLRPKAENHKLTKGVKKQTVVICVLGGYDGQPICGDYSHMVGQNRSPKVVGQGLNSATDVRSFWRIVKLRQYQVDYRPSNPSTIETCALFRTAPTFPMNF
jgi:hypothetical protein